MGNHTTKQNLESFLNWLGFLVKIQGEINAEVFWFLCLNLIGHKSNDVEVRENFWKETLSER